MNTKNLHEKIRMFRRLRGFTQEDLAEKLGVSYQQVQKYENGETQLTIERIREISFALNIPVEELLSAELYDRSDRSDGYAAVSEHLYRLTKDESEYLKLFRKIRNKRIREALIKLLKGMVEEEQKDD